MFSFTLLASDDNVSCKASLLTIDDDIRILADPSWNGKDHELLNFLEETLKQVNVILLSHSTPEFIGGYIMLCIKFPDIMKTMSVYSTSAVNQLGRVSTVEYYRSLGIIGPLKDALLEVSEVDEWFDRVQSLKYFQSLNALERLLIIPYNAGHTLGGTFWLIQRKLEKIIYAPSWNHSKDSFLNSASFLSSSTGNPISQLMRPTALITSADLGSNMSHKKRTEKFLQLVDATLVNGGTVLLPTTLSGRFLELLHLIDNHLQSAPIPVLFLSYSGTNVLRYASSLLEWMSPSLSKELENANSLTNSAGRAHFPFDPSKVDLIASPYELSQIAGPKVVFTSGVDLNNGDLSSEALRVLCQDEKTTILLTEKTYFGYENNINNQLYQQWLKLCKERNENVVEDGIAVPLEITLELDNWTLEEDLVGNELNDFKERIERNRKQKLVEQVRDRKNKALTGDDFVDSSSSDEDDDDDDEDEDDQEDEMEVVADGPTTDAKEDTQAQIGNEASKSDSVQNTEKETNGDVLMEDAESTEKRKQSTINITNKFTDDAATQEAVVTENIKTSFDQNLPLDIKITNKLRPRHAMFPYFPNKDKQDFDDYGAIINPKDFEKKDDTSKNFGFANKRNEGRNWGTRDDQHDDDRQQNKLTPQEILNNEIIKKNLDTLFRPRKRVAINSTGSTYTNSNLLKLLVRCGLAFVDLSGLVDLRSMSLIISSLKPLNLLILPDSSVNQSTKDDPDSNGLLKIQQMLKQQQLENDEIESQNSIMKSARYLSLQSIRMGSINNSKSNKMEVIIIDPNQPATIGSGENGINIGDFEVKLDEAIVDNLKWQTIDGSYRVAQLVGRLQVQHKKVNKKRKTVGDVLNQSSEFILRHEDQPQSSLTKNKLAIGNIRLPELKRRLMSKNLNAEFKSEGTLVVNDKVAISKVTYGAGESDDTGDIVINGQIGPLYYQVKECIRDMLAYV